MQNLDVISINLWDILISLCNLLILFLILKKFLYKPVMRIFKERENALERSYAEADEAKKAALENRVEWEEKKRKTENETEQILLKACKRAEQVSDEIISQAKENADTIIKNAKEEAAFEYKKAQTEIKKEIINVSATLTEKILNREINTKDHYEIIDSVISEIGEENE